ncbi:hypothetical protein FH972_024723 [Carpinus fangiana]|uniref:Alpha/beta hydrolase fold-3 domain-containing protein n=1 Tax=Carpinus fangiana TaxID=176857 RepID=A0A5N6L1D2_9ROSI|nr:hypothetical protein FH972_024723 [Carpinus fangiana]
MVAHTNPSLESQALGQLYKSKASRLDATSKIGMEALRSMYEEEQSCTSEAPGVSYEDVVAGGRPALWATPPGPNVHGVIMYFHGGGFSVGSPNSHRKVAGHLSKASNSYALILDYRLAPEHPYPAALDDTTAAYRWLLERGFKPSQIATAGDSAGGNLATSTVLRLRQEGVPLPAAIISFSPWYNLKNDFGTMTSNDARDMLVHRHQLDDMAATYVGKHSLVDPLTNPLYADLTGLPPIYIAVGSDETLEDDGVIFADKARKAGVTVEFERADGQQHVYVFMAGRAPEASLTIQRVGSWVAEQLR